MVEPEQEPTRTTLPKINTGLATASTQEVDSPNSRLEGKIDSLRAEMHGNLTMIMNSIMYMNFQIQTLQSTCQTMTGLSKRKRDDRDDPVHRKRKNNKKVHLDTSATAGTSAGAGPSNTHAGTHDNVAISSDSDGGDDDQKSPQNLGPLLLEDFARYFEVPLEDLSKFFRMPLEEAAKALHMSSTGFKIKCREFNLGGWPYRRLHSLQKLIENRKVIT